MTPADLAATEALCEAAIENGGCPHCPFINAFKSNIPALLDEVRRLQADNERMRRGLEEIDSVCGSRAYAVNAMLRNLLAGREWNESGVK